MHAASYHVLVDGVLQAEDLQELLAWRIVERAGGTTLLEGPVLDQPALLGVVARLEAMGCRVRDLYAVEPLVAGGHS